MWTQLLSGEAELFLASERGRCGLEVGDGRKFVPLDRLLAEVKVFESERDAAQKVVLTQWLSTEHTQLQLTQAQGFFAVATVHQLWRERVKKWATRLSCSVIGHKVLI